MNKYIKNDLGQTKLFRIMTIPSRMLPPSLFSPLTVPAHCI